MGRIFLWHISVKINFFTEFIRISINQIDRTFCTQLFKILTHFWNRAEKVCFLVHPELPLIIVARQNFFYQNFYLEKTFLEVCNKTHLPSWNFIVAHTFNHTPPLPSVVERSTIFTNTDSFIETIEYVLFSFRSKI